MPLTRNLYREDEVIAALKWCILKGRSSEAIFWLQECLDSHMRAEAIEALIWTWVFGCGPSALSWFLRLRLAFQRGADLTDTAIVDLAVSLIQHQRRVPNGSALALLVLGSSGYPVDNIGNPPMPAGEDDSAVSRAILQGKPRIAWSLLRTAWSPEAWSLVRRTGAWKHGAVAEHLDNVLNCLEMAPSWLDTDHWIWPFRAVAISALCVPKGQLAVAPEVGAPNLDLSAERLAYMDLSMRDRRIHPIPHDCLYWFTARGALRINETTDGELTHRLETAMEGSKFWDALRPDLTNSREAFYDTYFPDDIPDEWSLADRQKSHGIGTVALTPNPDYRIIFRRCLTAWFGKLPTPILWLGMENTINLLSETWSGTGRPASLEAGIVELYADLPEVEQTPSYPPTQRELVVN